MMFAIASWFERPHPRSTSRRHAQARAAAKAAALIGVQRCVARRTCTIRSRRSRTS